MSFLGRAGPRWFTVPPHRPFLEDLARGVSDALEPEGPLALAEATVLVPSRRAVRSLAEAFGRIGDGRARLLPQIRALGDLDEGEPPFEPGDLALDLPPAISPWRRRFELARLVSANAPLIGRSLDAAAALELADALGGFLDSLQIEEADPAIPLEEWAPEAMAAHWRISADFLRIALEAWPRRLAELGAMDVTARRIALLNALAERWLAHPPGHVLVAAGSTGSTPATARLLAVIAAAPKGCVVLPGLDTDLAETAWRQVGDEHPQGAMKRMLDQVGVARGDVAAWPGLLGGEAQGRWRRRILSEALRPAEATADWLVQIANLRAEGARDGVDAFAEGLAGLSLVSGRNEEDAAALAALALRETLETPDRTAALVTPDAAFARRVSAKLARWGIAADSSAGAPLAAFPTGDLASLAVAAVADTLDPVILLGLAKHALTRLGLSAGDLETARKAFERLALRGARARSWEAIIARLAEDAGAERLAGALRRALDIAAAPYTGGTATPAEAARALAEALETLAEGEAPGDVGLLWAGPAGETAADLIAALIGESDGLPEVTPAQFADLLQRLSASQTVRAGAATHPRLRILGVLEARLVRADRLVLAGLEEGVWPATPPVDPFLSRPMRKLAGLPPPERRIGLSAHDFAQAASAAEVVLVTTERREGAPAKLSRWIWRLATIARGAGVALPSRPDLAAWAEALEAPERFVPAPRPKPTPPVETRPRTLAVTAVERWVRDPYAVYARYILRLRPLERPDERVDARARGSAVHRAFERFAQDWPERLPPDAETLIAELMIEELAAAGMSAGRLTRERALAQNAARWVAGFERRRRGGGRLLVEQEGRMELRSAGGAFTLTARADRIEVARGVGHVLDIKTGVPPSQKQMESGLSPQLTLTAAILEAGGFTEAGPLTPGQLVYVRVSGGREPGAEIVRAQPGESLDLAERALAGLRRRIADFEARETPYLSWAAPQFVGVFEGDYDHLARLWEWHVIGDNEDTP